MEIIKTFNGNEATFAIEGWLDTQAASTMEEAINSLPSEVESLTFDLAKMEYISSSGLRIFLSIRKEAAAHGSKVIVRNISADIRQVFMMTGFISLFEIQ